MTKNDNENNNNFLGPKRFKKVRQSFEQKKYRKFRSRLIKIILGPILVPKNLTVLVWRKSRGIRIFLFKRDNIVVGIIVVNSFVFGWQIQRMRERIHQQEIIIVKLQTTLKLDENGETIKEETWLKRIS